MKNISNSIKLLVLLIFLSAQSVWAQPACNTSFQFTRAGAARVALLPAVGHNYNELYDATNGFTWEAWVYMADTNFLQTVFIGVEDAIVCQDIFIGTGWNGPGSNSLPIFMVRNNAGCGGGQVTGTTRLMPMTWYHIAGVCDYAAGFMSLYLNGVNIGTAPITFGAPGRLVRNITTSLGNFNSINTCSFNGNIDEVKFWTGVRTPANIIADAAGCTAFPQAGMLAYFKANEGAGTFAGSFVNSDFSGNNSAGWGPNAPVSICEPVATITSASVIVCDTVTISIPITFTLTNLPPGSAWSITMSDGSILTGTADASGNGSGTYYVLPGTNTTYTIISVAGFPCAVLSGSMDVTYISCCVCEMRIDGNTSTAICPAGIINGSFHLDAGSKKVKAVELSIPYFNYNFNGAPCQYNCADFMTGYSLGNFINPNPLAGAPPIFASCFPETFAREVDWNFTPGAIVNQIINYTITIPKTQCHIEYDYCIKVIVRYTDCTSCECLICFKNDVIVCSCQNRPPKEKPAFKATKLSDEGVTVYPNPNGGKFTVRMDKTIAAKVITMVDMTGKVVAKSVVDGDISNFEIGNIAAGTYNVIVTGAENVITKRVVITR